MLKKMNPNEREMEARNTIKHMELPTLLKYVADLKALYQMALNKCAYLDQTDNAHYRTAEQFDEIFRRELNVKQTQELQTLEE